MGPIYLRSGQESGDPIPGPFDASGDTGMFYAKTVATTP